MSKTEQTRPRVPLRRRRKTGTCAAAAARAAYPLLVTGECPGPVEVALADGRRIALAIAMHERDGTRATAGFVKDAGDDLDVTHGALIKACLLHGPVASGVAFRAGTGVGTVKPGLPLPPGEPAINPAARLMIGAAIAEVVQRFGASGDVAVVISVPGGEDLARRTLNAPPGIVGGLTILGTSGIVIPYSCAAWIATCHIDLDWPARSVGKAGAPADLISTTRGANTALRALEQAGRRTFPVADLGARAAWQTASRAVSGCGLASELAVFDGTGGLLATCDGSGVQSPLPRNRRR